MPPEIRAKYTIDIFKIFGIFATCAGVIYYAGELNQTVKDHERRITTIENVVTNPQAIENERRAIYNRNIKVKQP